MADLAIEGLSAFYGKAQALHEVSLSVAKGEIIAVSTTPINSAAARPTMSGTARRIRGRNSARVVARTAGLK